MTVDLDETRLDDVGALDAADPQHMLRAVATSAAQVRHSHSVAAESDLTRLIDAGRPRAIVVAGMGGSGISGDLLAAVAGPTCPVPILVHRGAGLPGWVGASDLVIAVSCSGRTQETLAATDEAIRRGAVLLGVGGAESPLSRRCVQARADFIPVTPELSPRSSLWALSMPLLFAAARLGLVDLGNGAEAVEQTATRLEEIAERSRPDRETFVNAAKSFAVELAGSLPMVWGAGVTGPVAALRLVCQLAENAKWPAVLGVLPEAHHNQVVALDGALAAATADDDLFRDRVDDEAPLRLRLVLIDDSSDDADAAARVRVSGEVAERRGMAMSRLVAEGSSRLERLASVVGLVDYASVYLALLQGVDPTPITAIDELKKRLG